MFVKCLFRKDSALHKSQSLLITLLIIQKQILKKSIIVSCEQVSGFEHYRSFPEMGIDRSNVQELDSQLIFTCSESTRETLEKV